ncbi:MAG: CBS domain-containing protein [Candidatus Helarchaeota archaeon]
MSVKIEDIMISDVKTLDVSSTVKDVVKEMDKNEIGSVIITKEGKPIGIITERDIVQKVVVKDKDANKLTASEIMSSPLKTGNKSMSLLDAVRILVLNRIKKLPILDDNGSLIGIISLFDLVRWAPLIQQMSEKEDLL